jgi:hypothetical protein
VSDDPNNTQLARSGRTGSLTRPTVGDGASATAAIADGLLMDPAQMLAAGRAAGYDVPNVDGPAVSSGLPGSITGAHGWATVSDEVSIYERARTMAAPTNDREARDRRLRPWLYQQQPSSPQPAVSAEQNANQIQPHFDSLSDEELERLDNAITDARVKRGAYGASFDSVPDDRSTGVTPHDGCGAAQGEVGRDRRQDRRHRGAVVDVGGERDRGWSAVLRSGGLSEPAGVNASPEVKAILKERTDDEKYVGELRQTRAGLAQLVREDEAAEDAKRVEAKRKELAKLVAAQVSILTSKACPAFKLLAEASNELQEVQTRLGAKAHELGFEANPFATLQAPADFQALLAMLSEAAEPHRYAKPVDPLLAEHLGPLNLQTGSYHGSLPVRRTERVPHTLEAGSGRLGSVQNPIKAGHGRDVPARPDLAALVTDDILAEAWRD